MMRSRKENTAHYNIIFPCLEIFDNYYTEREGICALLAILHVSTKEIKANIHTYQRHPAEFYKQVEWNLNLDRNIHEKCEIPGSKFLCMNCDDAYCANLIQHQLNIVVSSSDYYHYAFMQVTAEICEDFEIIITEDNVVTEDEIYFELDYEDKSILEFEEFSKTYIKDALIKNVQYFECKLWLSPYEQTEGSVLRAILAFLADYKLGRGVKQNNINIKNPAVGGLT